MKRSSKPCKGASDLALPVVMYPDGYRGQPLLPELIFFSNQLPPCTAEYHGFFKVLIKQFATEVGCGNSLLSSSYFNALKDGNCYFWSHDELPDIVLLSEMQNKGRKKQRVLRIMPRDQLLEIVGPDCLSELFEQQSDQVEAGKTTDGGPAQPAAHTLH